MGSFIDEYWESLWTGWTPVVVVIFFLVFLKLSGWFAGYFKTPPIWFIARFLTPFILALSVPFFSILAKRRR